jgi:hypothetical protein
MEVVKLLLASGASPGAKGKARNPRQVASPEPNAWF